MEPLVSVIIPTYNRPNWLGKSIESCLNQTYKNIEILVVDDGSTDASVKQVIANFKQVKYIYQENRGQGGARNTGILSSSGEYIQFLDDDDWLTDWSIERKIVSLVNSPDCSIVYSDLFVTNSDGMVQSKYYHSARRPLPHGNIFPILAKRNFIPIHALLIKKQPLIQVGGFPIRSGLEDWECLIKLAEICEFVFVDEPLGYYRLHQHNMSFNPTLRVKGETETQEYIINSQAFNRLSSNSRTSILTSFSLFQWLYGNVKDSNRYLTLAKKTNPYYPKLLAYLFFRIIGRRAGVLVHNQYWRAKTRDFSKVGLFFFKNQKSK